MVDVFPEMLSLKGNDRSFPDSYIQEMTSGTNIRVPVSKELKDINLCPSKTIMSIVAARSGPTKKVPSSPYPPGVGSASPDPLACGLHLVRPLR
jgi:hypothetical protein